LPDALRPVGRWRRHGWCRRGREGVRRVDYRGSARRRLAVARAGRGDLGAIAFLPAATL